MLNLLQKPIKQETLEAWAKITDDVAKLAFLAIPAMIYSEKPVSYLIIHTIGLSLGSYFFLLFGRYLRENTEGLK